MDDVLGRKAIAACNNCLANFARSDVVAFRLQLFSPGSRENSSAYPTTLFQGCICGVDNGINGYLGYIVSDYFQWHKWGFSFR